MVEQECQRWAAKGINIRYESRENRTGYKAGALKEGLKRSYVKHCEYVAIFDVDFRLEPDYLRRAIPYLVQNSDIALVQARWRFGKLQFNLMKIMYYVLSLIQKILVKKNSLNKILSRFHGAIMYEMLVRYPPFYADDLIITCKKVIHLMLLWVSSSELRHISRIFSLSLSSSPLLICSFHFHQ